MILTWQNFSFHPIVECRMSHGYIPALFYHCSPIVFLLFSH